ncbi:MAG TPA: cupin domain-containing protein [Myxococcales bacterium]|nr:cupin domain-containing protein [Myxococcales bacterium]
MIEVKSFAGLRRFAPDKLQKLNLFETERFFCDVYCLEPGQEQKAHAHAGSDKLYAVLDGAVVVSVGSETREVRAGEIVLCPAGSQHGVVNRSETRAALLVFMAPRP